MPHLSRREMIVSAGLAAAFGLTTRLVAPDFALAQQTTPPEPGFYRYKIGSIGVTAIHDGIWEKPHDPVFLKNAGVEDTKAALTKAGLPADFVSIPLTVSVIDTGNALILCDSGSGGQWQPTAGKLMANMKAAGIDPAKIGTVLISHFHPDHIFGLMEKETNRPIFPNAEIVVSANEYKWWTEAGRVEALPAARKPLGARIQAVFPTWKNIRPVDGEKEVAPGIRFVSVPGHTAGHVAFHLASGNEQLMLSNDTFYVPALLAPHPEWQGIYDQDGPLAVEQRRKLAERVIGEKMAVSGAHFPFPGVATFAKDGAGYALTLRKA